MCRGDPGDPIGRPDSDVVPTTLIAPGAPALSRVLMVTIGAIVLTVWVAQVNPATPETQVVPAIMVILVSPVVSVSFPRTRTHQQK